MTIEAIRGLNPIFLRSLTLQFVIINDPEINRKLGSMKNLRELKLKDCRFNLDFLKSLIDLQVLSLGNYLENIEPAIIFNLPHLIKLELSTNY